MEVLVVKVSRSAKPHEVDVGLEPLDERFMLVTLVAAEAPITSSAVLMRCLGRRANDEERELADERTRGMLFVAGGVAVAPVFVGFMVNGD